MEPAQPLRPETSVVLLVDLQEKLTPHIADIERVRERSRVLLRAAAEMGVPIVVSQQNTQRLGPTEPALLEGHSGFARIEKMTFSCCACDAGMSALPAARPQVLIAGIETHVCVQQTVLDLLRAGRQPVVLADAVSSRRVMDREVALQRMARAGAVVTTVESAIYELMHEAGTDLFRRVLPLVK
jgi:nicotinamidase-related amidase